MSGDLKWNKIFGASLGTALAILLVQQVSDAIYTTKAPEKPGYLVNAPEEAEAGAAEVELAPDWGTLIPVADLAAGEAAFARCVACHTINAGGANGIGPNLYGVVGGPVLHAAGFADVHTGRPILQMNQILHLLSRDAHQRGELVKPLPAHHAVHRHLTPCAACILQLNGRLQHIACAAAGSLA
jgi:hypothetical protein